MAKLTRRGCPFEQKFSRFRCSVLYGLPKARDVSPSLAPALCALELVVREHV